MNKRVDKNQREITFALRRHPGISVCVTSMLGKGFPDIIVGYDGKNYMFEIKKSEKGRLTKDEESFRRQWCGNIATIWSVGQILDIIGYTNTEKNK